MKAEEFGPGMSGRLVPTAEGQLAFAPEPLPPTLAWDDTLALALSRADTALSELSGLGRYLPNPHLLIIPYTRREAILSSRIEGTRANLSDLLRDEAGEAAPDDATSAEDIREVRNYVTALEYGIAQLQTLPISLRLIRGMHARLLEGVRGDHARAGEFRDRQNWIGEPGSGIREAQFVPPPPAEMLGALGEWERFANTIGALPDLVQCALLHQQFETIHPFIDGNGRLGRMLIILFLLQRRRLSQPLLYLSAYFEAHRRDYYALLQRVRTDGDWSAWLLFFLRGVAETASAALRQAGELMDLRESYHAALRDKGTALALVDQLFTNPYTTVARAAAQLAVSNPAARAAVNLLEERRILTEITGKSWGKTYVALPILRVISPEEAGMSRAVGKADDAE